MTTSSSYIPVWLVCEGRVLSSAQMAVTRHDRRVGLRKTEPHHEPLVIDNCRWVHTLGMKYELDVAFLNDQQQVVSMHRVRPWRIDRPVRGACKVIEAPSGAFDRWSLKLGDVVEVRHVEGSQNEERDGSR